MKTKNFELTFAKIYPNFTKELLKISDEFTSVARLAIVSIPSSENSKSTLQVS